MFSCVLLNIVKNNFNDDVCLLGPMAMRPMWHTGPSPCTSPQCHHHGKCFSVLSNVMPSLHQPCPDHHHSNTTHVPMCHPLDHIYQVCGQIVVLIIFVLKPQ